jgi:2-polyprenyl-3-methyl-5-hydroxy-6-metoxy-1,4-benzoquinol methylase
METYLYDELYQMEEKHWWFVARRKIILDIFRRFVPTTNTIKILDIGCGTGLMLQVLNQYGEVSGIDSSPLAIEYARKRTNNVIQLGVLPNNIPYTGTTFDVVTAFDVLEHIENDVEAISTISKLLKDSGIFICTVPAYQFLWSSHDEAHHHYRRYTKNSLQKKLLSAGFKMIKITYYNFFLFPLIALIRLLKRIQRPSSIGSDTQMPHSLLNKILIKIFSSEKYFLRWANLPFGVSLLSVSRKAHYHS